MIEFTQEVCANLGEAVRREWLETNGLGGFASSSIAGLNTRRYHGLLVAATKPPVGRLVLLSKLEETLIIDGRRYELSAKARQMLAEAGVADTEVDDLFSGIRGLIDDRPVRSLRLFQRDHDIARPARRA